MIFIEIIGTDEIYHSSSWETDQDEINTSIQLLANDTKRQASNDRRNNKYLS